MNVYDCLDMRHSQPLGVFKILSGMANSVDPDQTAPSGAV